MIGMNNTTRLSGQTPNLIKARPWIAFEKRKQDEQVSTKPHKAKTGRGSSTAKVILQTLKGSTEGPNQEGEWARVRMGG